MGTLPSPSSPLGVVSPPGGGGTPPPSLPLPSALFFGGVAAVRRVQKKFPGKPNRSEVIPVNLLNVVVVVDLDPNQLVGFLEFPFVSGSDSGLDLN